MCIEINKLIEIARAMGTTDATVVNRIIDAQDYALQKQKEKTGSARKKAEWACVEPTFYR
jgi:hypothetical protein